MNWSSEWESEWLSNHWREVTLIIPGKFVAPVKVQAWQVGDLAVHKFIDIEGKLEDRWKVTHVPTLCSFDKAVPVDDAFKEALLSWCYKVQLEHKDLWELLRSFTNENYKSIRFDLLNQIREWCLSIKV